MHHHRHPHRDLELMLRIERSLRPVEVQVHGPTVWSETETSSGGATSSCAACGCGGAVADPRCGNVPFCPECIDRGRNLTEWDDLGGGD